ncbi:uncharacterized protein LOC134404404 [Elgaria multicarinata webbii]|uniref:uncharacterized protein LOC134404404 n=1 Tax=Elgaria multicarinata webbii TaxID=159646 RepID=UPI002FCD44F6
MGFSKSIADPCLYTKGSGKDYKALILFVDDILISCYSDAEVQKVAQQLASKYNLKSLGPVKNYLRVEVKQTEDRSFLLSQKQKIEMLLEQCEMQDCKPVKSPIELNIQSTLQSECFSNPDLYRSVVRMLLYLVNWSRPDLSASVAILSKFVAKPTIPAWNALKRVLRYLKGTLEHGLSLSAEPDEDLLCYVDSD